LKDREKTLIPGRSSKSFWQKRRKFTNKKNSSF